MLRDHSFHIPPVIIAPGRSIAGKGEARHKIQWEVQLGVAE
jgi:hypothetical protein